MKVKVAREVEKQYKKVEKKAKKEAEKKAKKVLKAAKKIKCNVNWNAKKSAKEKANRKANKDAEVESFSSSFTTVDVLRTPEKRKRLVSENVMSVDASSSYNLNTVRRFTSSLLILTTFHTITLHRSSPDAPAKKKQKRGKSSLIKIGEGIRLFTKIAFDGALKEELDKEYVQAQRVLVCTKDRLGVVFDRSNVSGQALTRLS